LAVDHVLIEHVVTQLGGGELFAWDFLDLEQLKRFAADRQADVRLEVAFDVFRGSDFDQSSVRTRGTNLVPGHAEYKFDGDFADGVARAFHIKNVITVLLL